MAGNSLVDNYKKKIELFIFLYFDRIRKSGYPIRHTFKEFIDRYYMLSDVLAPSQYDFQALKHVTVTIAKRVMGGSDWQMGKNKIFLKVRNVLAS